MYQDELTHVFTDANVKAVIVQHALFLMRVKDYVADIPLVVQIGDLDWAENGPEAVFGPYRDLPEIPLPDLKPLVEERLDKDFVPLDMQPEHPSLIGYTSGTSGRAKGAVRAHANISSNSRMAARNAGLPPGSGIVSLAPLFHITGFICQMIASVANGGTHGLTDRYYPPSLLDMLTH